MFLLKLVQDVSQGVTLKDKFILLLRWFWVVPLGFFGFSKLRDSLRNRPWFLFPGVCVFLNGKKFYCERESNYASLRISFERNLWDFVNFKGDVFIDGGANIGRYSITLADNFNKVYAFEPFPHNLEILRKNISLNSVKNVEVVNGALWSEVCTKTLFVKGGGTNSLVDREMAVGRLKVKTTTLDMFLRKRKIAPSQVSLVKLDVEGAELEVLKGAKRLLSVGRPVIIFEALDNHSLETVSTFLERYRFKVKWICDRNYIARKVKT